MKPNFVPWHQYYTTFLCTCKDPNSRAIDEIRQQPFPNLQPPAPQPSEVQEACQFLPATAMHEAGKFKLVSVAEVDGRWHYTFSRSPP